jgi:hypothetical protein
MITPSTSAGFTFDRSTAAFMATAPISGARIPANEPWNLPTAVRAAPTINVSLAFPIVIFYSFQ